MCLPLPALPLSLKSPEILSYTQILRSVHHSHGHRRITQKTCGSPVMDFGGTLQAIAIRTQARDLLPKGMESQRCGRDTYKGYRLSSTRRFFACPSGVSLAAIGSVSPNPFAAIRLGLTPCEIRN